MAAQTSSTDMQSTQTPKGAWTITFLLFLFMLVNFADKIVVGLAAVPIMTELKLEPKEFGLLGSSFFFLFSISAIVVGFIVNRVPTRWVLLVLAVIWALAQFPMVGTVGLTTLMICRIILGAGEGPAFSVAAHAIYKWFPDEKRTLPTAILSQGSAFGVIVAVPALNWLIVNYSWHYAFGALGVVGLLWVVVWLFMGKEGPLVHTAAAGGAAETRIPYFAAPDVADLHRLRRRDLRRLLGAVAGADLVHLLHHPGARLLAAAGGLHLHPALDLRRHHRDPHGVDLAGPDGARHVHPRRPRRAGFGAADHRRRDPGADASCQRRGPADRASRGRLRPVRIDLRGLPADAGRVHAGVAARRHHRDLRRALHAGRHHRALCHGQRDPERGRHGRTAT